MARSLRERLDDYKQYKAFGKFSDDLVNLAGRGLVKPHYIRLSVGKRHVWVQLVSLERFHERRLLEVSMFGNVLRFPGLPDQPQIIARFVVASGAENLCGVVGRVEAQICGQPFLLHNIDYRRGEDIPSTVEYVWRQKGFGHSNHVQGRAGAVRIKHDFLVQASFGGPAFEVEKAKWQDRHDWSPKERKRREVRKVYPIDYGFDYDYSEEDFEEEFE